MWSVTLKNQWLSPDTLSIAINKADRYEILSIINKLALNTLYHNLLLPVLSNNSERKMYENHPKYFLYQWIV
jgi:hypothetical protein